MGEAGSAQISKAQSSCSESTEPGAGTDKQYLHGWERQFQFLASKWAGVAQSERVPQVMWRGRTEDAEFPKRDAMRCGPVHHMQHRALASLLGGSCSLEAAWHLVSALAVDTACKVGGPDLGFWAGGSS